MKDIEAVLMTLRKLRQDSIKDFEGLRGSIKKEYGKVKKLSNAIDLVGTLSTLGVSMGFNVKDAYKASQLAGKELQAANKKFLKGFVVDKSIADTQLISRALRLRHVGLDVGLSITP